MKFFKNWQKGMMMVTPEQRLKVDIFSLRMVIIGSIAGGIGLLVSFFILKTWWYIALSIMLIFSGVMQINQYIEKLQMIKTLKDINNMEQINTNLDDPNLTTEEAIIINNEIDDIIKNGGDYIG